MGNERGPSDRVGRPHLDLGEDVVGSGCARHSVSRVIPQYVLSDVDHIVGRKMLNG